MIKVAKYEEGIDHNSVPIGTKFVSINHGDEPAYYYCQLIYKTTKFGDNWAEDSYGEINQPK